MAQFVLRKHTLDVKMIVPLFFSGPLLNRPSNSRTNAPKAGAIDNTHTSGVKSTLIDGGVAGTQDDRMGQHVAENENQPKMSMDDDRNKLKLG